jgi:hypothetical protein
VGPKFAWFDTPIPVRGGGGSLLDRYGVWVDWREVDEEIVGEISERLLRTRLQAHVTDIALVISFDGTSTTLTIDDIGTERYQTIRALNAALHPHFELRLVRKTAGSDTHCFLPAPAWLWQALERIDSNKLDSKIKRIDARDGFTT